MFLSILIVYSLPKVFEGSDASGRLLGTYSKSASSSEPLRSASGSLYLELETFSSASGLGFNGTFSSGESYVTLL